MPESPRGRTSATTWVDQRSSSRTERLLPTNNRGWKASPNPLGPRSKVRKSALFQGSLQSGLQFRTKRINLRGEGPGKGTSVIAMLRCSRVVSSTSLACRRLPLVRGQWHQQAVRGVPGQKQAVVRWWVDRPNATTLDRAPRPLHPASHPKAVWPISRMPEAMSANTGHPKTPRPARPSLTWSRQRPDKDDALLFCHQSLSHLLRGRTTGRVEHLRRRGNSAETVREWGWQERLIKADVEMHHTSFGRTPRIQRQSRSVRTRISNQRAINRSGNMAT